MRRLNGETGERERRSFPHVRHVRVLRAVGPHRQAVPGPGSHKERIAREGSTMCSGDRGSSGSCPPALEHLQDLKGEPDETTADGTDWPPPPRTSTQVRRLRTSSSDAVPRHRGVALHALLHSRHGDPHAADRGSHCGARSGPVVNATNHGPLASVRPRAWKAVPGHDIR